MGKDRTKHKGKSLKVVTPDKRFYQSSSEHCGITNYLIGLRNVPDPSLGKPVACFVGGVCPQTLELFLVLNRLKFTFFPINLFSTKGR